MLGSCVQSCQHVKFGNCAGWDISSLNMADAMKRAQVLDVALQQQLTPHMESMKPRPSVYYPDFIAANQSDRADNVIGGNSKWDHLEHLRADIRDFKMSKQLDTVSCFHLLRLHQHVIRKAC